MKRTLILIALMVTVPILAYWAGNAITGEMDAGWYEVVLEEMGPEAAEHPVMHLSQLCQDAEVRAELDFCFDYRLNTWMKSGALVAGALGLGLLGLIWLVGRFAQTNRKLLWLLFTPGLYITIFGLIGLILLHGVLGMGAIWFGESYLVGRVHIQVLLLIGIAAVTGTFGMAKAALGLLKKVPTEVFGKLLGREQSRVSDFVAEIARRLGTEPPDQIVVGLGPNFFVTEAEVECEDGKMSGRTLFLSLPLCRVLSKNELAAIVGHELGHFRGEDTQFSKRFYPIYRGASAALEAVAARTDSFAAGVALFPAVYTLNHFLESFAVAESAVSREREFLADQAGVEAADLDAMASALVKVHAYSANWGQVAEAMGTLAAEGQSYPNFSTAFADHVREHASPEGLEGIDQLQLPHPTDSHPPLSQRLEALQRSMAQVEGAALRVEPGQPAIQLFDGAEGMEEELTGMLRRAMRLGA